jgi:hypothetical protein
MRPLCIGAIATVGLAAILLVGCGKVENLETVSGTVSRVRIEDDTNIATFQLEGSSTSYWCVVSYVIDCGFLAVNDKVTVTAGHKTDGDRENYVTELILIPKPS